MHTPPPHPTQTNLCLIFKSADDTAALGEVYKGDESPSWHLVSDLILYGEMNTLS